MTFEQYLETSKMLDEKVSQTSNALKSFPRGDMGLVSDEVKASLEFQTAKAAYENAFQSARNLASFVPKKYLKDASKLRRKNWCKS